MLAGMPTHYHISCRVRNVLGFPCTGEYEFEVRITPHDPNKVSSEETGEDEKPLPIQYAEYLVDLARRVFEIPVMHGVDQGDYEMLREIASHFDSEVVRCHDDENEY